MQGSHRTTSRRADPVRRSLYLSGGIAAAIVYGSLFPFDFFYGAGDLNRAVHALIASWRAATSRGDLIANILLYLPLGFCVVRSLRRPSIARLLLATLLGAGLSICMELAQFYVPDRYTSMSDVYANAAGTLLGAILGITLRPESRLPVLKKIELRPFPLLLLAAWVGYRLFPFVPVIDLHKYWTALKPVVIAPTLSVLDLYSQTVIWLVIGLLFESLFRMSRGRLLLILFMPALLFTRILVVYKILSPSEVVGAVIGVAIWFSVLSRLPNRAALIGILFTTVIVLRALDPFQFSSKARPFGWIPFSSLLQAPPVAGVLTFLEKVFMYGALLWVTVRAGCSFPLAAALNGALVLCLNILQLYLPGRWAEITDLLILFGLAAVVGLLEGSGIRRMLIPHSNFCRKPVATGLSKFEK